jgi:hypothetical protein
MKINVEKYVQNNKIQNLCYRNGSRSRTHKSSSIYGPYMQMVYWYWLVIKNTVTPSYSHLFVSYWLVDWYIKYIPVMAIIIATRTMTSKKLEQELAELLEDDANADKLRSIPLYSCRITGWKFVCSKCYDKVHNRMLL